MNGLASLENWRTVLNESFAQTGAKLASFAPQLVAALLILVVGWVISKAVEKISVRAMRRFGLDRAAARLGVGEALQRAGIDSGASGVLGRLLFWILWLAFLLPALEAMGLTVVAATIDRLVGYLPNVLAAALILLLGLLAGRLVQNLVGSAAAVARIGSARQLGAAANALIATTVVVLALEQLGVETRFLIVVAATVAATLGLSMGVGLALGANRVFAHIFAGHFLRQTLRNGDSVEVGGKRGTVDRINAVDTLFRDGDRAWSIPNGALLEERIER